MTIEIGSWNFFANTAGNQIKSDKIQYQRQKARSELTD